MAATCKLTTCCDLDDFPQTSSSLGNCPTGYYWNSIRESCLRTPANALLGADGQPILSVPDGEPLLSIP